MRHTCCLSSLLVVYVYSVIRGAWRSTTGLRNVRRRTKRRTQNAPLIGFGEGGHYVDRDLGCCCLAAAASAICRIIRALPRSRIRWRPSPPASSDPFAVAAARIAICVCWSTRWALVSWGVLGVTVIGPAKTPPLSPEGMGCDGGASGGATTRRSRKAQFAACSASGMAACCSGLLPPTSGG